MKKGIFFLSYFLFFPAILLAAPFENLNPNHLEQVLLNGKTLNCYLVGNEIVPVKVKLSQVKYRTKRAIFKTRRRKLRKIGDGNKKKIKRLRRRLRLEEEACRVLEEPAPEEPAFIEPDMDNDGIADVRDNCESIANPDQLNLDDDPYGDECDPDDDNDGYPDLIDCNATDPTRYKMAVLDVDNDGLVTDSPDAIRKCIGLQGDGYFIPKVANRDNCPNDYNPEQEDFIGNGIGDICDTSPVMLAESSTNLSHTYTSAGNEFNLTLPKTAITSNEVAVLVNDQDQQSVDVANYYINARNIPSENVILLSFTPTGTDMPVSTFEALLEQVNANVGDNIQALAISWTTPWRVGRMSITSAFALGYSSDWYSSCGRTCCSTGTSPYPKASPNPKEDAGIHLVSMLGGENTNYAYELIDRSIEADQTFPTGDGYFVRTTNAARSVRGFTFSSTVNQLHDPINALSLFYHDGRTEGNLIVNTPNILFYMTGLTTVAGLDTNTYLPGSFADHLTSFAGRITGPNGQMSALRWLEAGASGTYGTVVEPCAFTAKFPDSSHLVPDYFSGATLGQAMWASVSMPGEGLFLGDPLTRPWGTVASEMVNGDRGFTTTELEPGVSYLLAGSHMPGEALQPIEYITLSSQNHQLVNNDLPGNYSYYYLLPREYFN